MKRLDVLKRLEKTVAKNVEKDYRKDFELDKEMLLNGGIQNYYFMVRDTGTVLVTEDELNENEQAKAVWNFYSSNPKNKKFKVSVNEIKECTVTGTIQNLKAA